MQSSWVVADYCVHGHPASGVRGRRRGEGFPIQRSGIGAAFKSHFAETELRTTSQELPSPLTRHQAFGIARQPARGHGTDVASLSRQNVQRLACRESVSSFGAAELVGVAIAPQYSLTRSDVFSPIGLSLALAWRLLARAGARCRTHVHNRPDCRRCPTQGRGRPVVHQSLSRLPERFFDRIALSMPSRGPIHARCIGRPKHLRVRNKSRCRRTARQESAVPFDGISGHHAVNRARLRMKASCSYGRQPCDVKEEARATVPARGKRAGDYEPWGGVALFHADACFAVSWQRTER